jgi:hypothetical protein
MRAATLVLLDEDAQALDDRKADWTASLLPRGAAEQRIVEDAVEYSWLRDRARRAPEARLAANMVNSGIDEANREADEVLRLGQKLFSDQRGPLANYPHYDREVDEFPENVPLVSESEILDGDPEDPQRLVLRLQATAGGCQWMLDRWSELRSILEEGLDWQSADKLKAVRLLGRHPIEAVDDRNVLMIFVACQTIESRTGKLIPEIWNELRKFERKQYAERLIGRGIEMLRPTDAAAARQARYALIDRAPAQIALKAEAHRARAEINDSLAADRLAFDDSPEGERLHRFDLACGRGLARSLYSLLKLRRAPELVDGSSSDLAGSVSAAGDTLESNETPNETIEATVDSESMTNEATDAREKTTNEPTVDCEKVTNEPTVAADVGLESPTYVKALEQNATNEANDAAEIATNEPTDGRENATNEPTVAADVGLESPTYVKATGQNATIEPALAAQGEGGRGVDTTAGVNHADVSDFHKEIDRQKVGEWIRAASARMATLRAERLSEFNDGSRIEANEANAGRRPRPEWYKKAKPADRAKKRTARISPERRGQRQHGHSAIRPKKGTPARA